MTLLDLLQHGATLRDQGAALALEAEPAWRQRAERWISEVPIGDTFTADDLVREVGLPYDSTRRGRNAVGGVILAAARRHLIIMVGVADSERRERRHGIVRIWRRQ